jgi:hypothetical protein
MEGNETTKVEFLKWAGELRSASQMLGKDAYMYRNIEKERKRKTETEDNGIYNRAVKGKSD